MAELKSGFHTLLGSDVQRDGMYLELNDGPRGRNLAEIFYSDIDGSMTISLFQPDLPLEALEEFIAIAKGSLPPTSENGKA